MYSLTWIINNDVIYWGDASLVDDMLTGSYMNFNYNSETCF